MLFVNTPKPTTLEKDAMKKKDTYFLAFSRNVQAGFTLIELLVVIAILALLMGLIVPVLTSARQAAINIKCLSNLKSIGVATSVYMTENKGDYPSRWITTGPYADQFPQVALYPYLSETMIFHCPRMRSKKLLRFQNPLNPSQTIETYMSYGINAAMGRWYGTYGGPLNASNISSPSSVIYMADMHWEGKDNRDPAEIQDWNLWGSMWANRTVISDRHKGKGNVLFADLHVSAHAYEDQFSGGSLFSGWFPESP